MLPQVNTQMIRKPKSLVVTGPPGCYALCAATDQYTNSRFAAEKEFDNHKAQNKKMRRIFKPRYFLWRCSGPEFLKDCGGQGLEHLGSSTGQGKGDEIIRMW